MDRAVNRRLLVSGVVVFAAFLAVFVPGFQLYWFRPDLHTTRGLAYVIVSAVVVDLSWTLTAMLLYSRLARALRRAAGEAA